MSKNSYEFQAFIKNANEQIDACVENGTILKLHIDFFFSSINKCLQIHYSLHKRDNHKCFSLKLFFMHSLLFPILSWPPLISFVDHELMGVAQEFYENPFCISHRLVIFHKARNARKKFLRKKF